jgi:hypothetical protein
MGDTQVRLGGDTKGLEQALRKALAVQERYTRRIESMNQRLRDQASRNKRQFEKAHDSSFGSKALSSIKNYALGFASISTAVTAATRLIERMNQTVERGKQGLKELEGPLSRMATVTDKATSIAFLTEDVKDIRRAGGVGADEAGRLAFNLRSFGLTRKKEREAFGELFQLRDIDPSSLVGGVAKLQTQFPGLGTPRQLLSGIFKAAAESEVSPSELAPAIATFAPAAPLVGATGEESIAALASLTKATKNPEEAATQLKAFAVAASRLEEKYPGTAAGGFVQTARNIQGLNLTGSALTEALPRQALFGSRNLLKTAGQLGRVRGEVGDIFAGRSDFLRDQVLSSIRESPILQANVLARQAEQERKISEEETPAAMAALSVERTRNRISTGLNRLAAGGGFGSRVGAGILELGLDAAQAIRPQEWEPAFFRRILGARVPGAGGLNVEQVFLDGIRGKTLANPIRRGDKTENE